MTAITGRTLETFTYVFEQHSATTPEIADAIWDGDRDLAGGVLTSLFGQPDLFDDLETGYVGLESDGSHPRHISGEYLPAVWQCRLTCDEHTLQQSLAAAGFDGAVAR